MIGAQTTVVWTAPIDLSLKLAGHITRLQVILAALVILDVGRNQRLLYAMFLATFLVVYIAVLKQDFGRHNFQTFFTQGLCLAVENIGADFITQWKLLPDSPISNTTQLPSARKYSKPVPPNSISMDLEKGLAVSRNHFNAIP